MIERQVIVTWEDPDKKKPEPDRFVVCSVSAKAGYITYDHAFAIADHLEDDDGWFFLDPLLERYHDVITVHAWADLEPYKGG